MKIIAFCLGWGLSAFAAADPVWHWKDFEILGNRKTARERIVKKLPLTLGTAYVEDLPGWQKLCAGLVRDFNWAHAECSAVRFADGRAYFVVDVIEKGEEARNHFRKPPTETVTIASAEIRALYKKIMDRLWSLFGQGKPPMEKVTEDYLDYEDADMHAAVLELRKKVPAHRKSILRGLALDKDVTDRMMAADLLNWAGDNSETILSTYRYLDDPNGGVRNQLTRFMTHYVEKLNDGPRLHGLIDALAIQLDRPSHGDRNKALYALVPIAKRHPSLASYLKEKVGKTAKDIAERSRLENIVDPARELLKIIGD